MRLPSKGICKGVLTTERGEREAGVTATGSPPAVAGLVCGKVPLKEMEKQGALTVSGERAALMRLADHYQMPPKAEIGP